MGGYSFYLIIALAVGAMWLMSSRTRKQQREALDFRNHLVPGDEVMTGSGLVGTVVEVEGDIVTLESTPGSQTRWVLRAITQRFETPVPVDDDELAEDLDDEDGYEDEDEDGYDEVEVPDDVSSLTGAAAVEHTDDDLVDDEEVLDGDEDLDAEDDHAEDDKHQDGTTPDHK